MKDSAEQLELDALPAPLEPQTRNVAPVNQAAIAEEVAERVARLKARLTWRELWALRRRHKRLWKRLNRAHYNALAQALDNAARRYRTLAEKFQQAKHGGGGDAATLAKIRESALAIARQGRELQQQLAPLVPLITEYRAINNRLEAHNQVLKLEREEAENRAAFFQEKSVYEQQIRAVFRQNPLLHHAGKDSKGRDFIRTPQIEHVYIKEDQIFYQIRTTSQNWLERITGHWHSELPYGVLPKNLTSDETLATLSMHTDRSVTVERGQRGQTLFYVVNRLDSPDGIPERVLYSKVAQYYPQDLHAKTPWGAGVSKNRKVEWLTLEDHPNVLIAGSAGGGKSNQLNGMIATWCAFNTPAELRLVLIDNKGGIEFTHWQGAKHIIGDMIKDESEVCGALENIVAMVKRRLAVMEHIKAKKLSEFNLRVKPEDRLPRIVVCIDEMATLLGLPDTADIHQHLKVISAQGRAAGVHLVICTQHVSVDIVPGPIKTNMQVRVSGKMPSEVASRIILDTMSAALLPAIAGRMVFSLGRIEFVAQTPLISDAEIAQAVTISRSYPDADNREFTAAALVARERFTKDDLIALALGEFGGKLTSEKIHESAGGNDVVSLRTVRAMIKEIVAQSGKIEFEGRIYRTHKNRNSHILSAIEPPAEQKSALIQ